MHLTEVYLLTSLKYGTTRSCQPDRLLLCLMTAHSIRHDVQARIPPTNNHKRKAKLMYVSVHHTIHDPQKWDQTTRNIMGMMEQGRLPAGLKGHMYLPGMDGQKADCIWEANSVEALKAFLDREAGTAATNEYMAIKTDAAVGLPGQEHAQKVA